MMQIRDHPGRSTEIGKALGLEPAQVLARLDAGDRCVRYEWCWSALLATLRRQSRVHITNSRRARCFRGVGYNLLNLLVGPWGVPWGLAWTVRAVWINLLGGIDVTDEVRRILTDPRAAVE
jgi:hypothetical protein